MKTALITGVMGQVGSHMADYLLERDYKVVGLRRRSASGSNWRLKTALLNERFELVEGDLTDSSSVTNLIQKYRPNEVYNFAAQSHVGTSFDQPNITFDVNTRGVLNILDSIRVLGLNDKVKLYQSSTSEMFGSNFNTMFQQGQISNPDFSPCVWYQDEHTPFSPNSPYAASKLAAHNLVKIYRESYGIFAVGGIMFNTEGPRRNINFVTRKITSYFNKLKSTRSPKLKLGNLDACRDWSYAKEAVEAIHLMLNNTTPKEYVIGTGETHTVKDFLNEVWSWHLENQWNYDIHCDIDMNYFVEIDETCKRPLEVPYLKSDPSQINRELGWTAKTKFKDLVRIMCEEENGLA